MMKLSDEAIFRNLIAKALFVLQISLNFLFPDTNTAKLQSEQKIEVKRAILVINVIEISPFYVSLQAFFFDEANF